MSNASQKPFEKLTQSRKAAEKHVVFGRFYCSFAFFASLREINSAFSNSLSGSADLRPRYRITDFGVASMRVTTMRERSSISPTLGPISFFQVSVSYTALYSRSRSSSLSKRRIQM